MSDASTTVSLNSTLGAVFAGAGAAAGFGVAFLVGPVVGWRLERIDSAPGPLRLVDQLPLAASIPLLTVLGALAGWIVFSLWSDDVGRVVIDQQTIRLETKDAAAEYSRGEIAQIFLDKDDLVLIGDRAQELSRTTSDSGLEPRLAQAFEQFDYPWCGVGDPREREFTDWVDRSAALSEHVHALLRARRRALADGRTGEAESLRDQLAERGVVARDRSDRQQYRLLEQS